MERTIDVTITVYDATGSAEIYFYENESGDHHRIEVDALDRETAMEVGEEILGWIDLMRENIEQEKEDYE